MLIKELFMDSKIFQYPKEIFNEGVVLNIYKKQFPEILKEYKRIVKYTYLNPSKYKEKVLKKSKEFDKNFEALFQKYKFIKKDLENLIKFDIEMHKNYAFNFWLISYAMNDGPIAFYYIEEIKKLIRKLFPDKKEALVINNFFLRTDYEIFYHKIIRTSVEMFNFLSRFPELKELLEIAKKKRNRRKVWDTILNTLKKKEGNKKFLKQLYEKWRWILNLENKTIFYTIMNEAIDNYEENVKKVKELEETRKTIEEVLKVANKKLSQKEAENLKKLYLLIKYMLWAKDSVFGKKDLKLLPFWFKLTKDIVRKWEEKYKVKISLEDSSFLVVPWPFNKKRDLSGRSQIHAS